jgi:hypothetical protein
MAQELRPVNGQPVRVVPWWDYMRDRPPLPPVHALHGDGPYLDAEELAEMVGPATAARLLADRSAVQLGEVDVLLHQLRGCP